MGGGAAHGLRSRGGRRRASGRDGLRVPPGRRLSRRVRRHHVAAPDRGERVAGPAAPPRRQARPVRRGRAGVRGPGRAGRRSRTRRGYQAGRGRRAADPAAATAGRARRGRHARLLRGRRRRHLGHVAGHGEEPLRPRPGPAAPVCSASAREPIREPERLTCARRRPMRGQMTHLDTDVLAEFRAGLITGRRGAKISAHLASCDRCTALDDRLAGVSVLLASVPAPPMPDRVAQRLDTVLAAEAANRNDPERAGKGSSRKATTPGRPTARRGFRLPSPRVLAPVAAAVVALAAGGYGLSLIGGGSTSSMQAASGTAPSASSSAAASAAKGAAEPAASARSQFKSSSQTVDVTPGTLRQYVEAELRLPRAERPTQPASSLVRGCVQRVAGTAPLELVQSALFEGQPTTIIVARTGQDYTAWVAGLDCSATNRDVLYLTTVPSGISGP